MIFQFQNANANGQLCVDFFTLKKSTLTFSDQEAVNDPGFALKQMKIATKVLNTDFYFDHSHTSLIGRSLAEKKQAQISNTKIKEIQYFETLLAKNNIHHESIRNGEITVEEAMHRIQDQYLPNAANLLRSNPENNRLRLAVAKHHARKGNILEASLIIEGIPEGLRYDSQDTSKLAKIYNKIGETHRAQEIFEAQFEAHSNKPWAIGNLLRFYVSNEMKQEAIELALYSYENVPYNKNKLVIDTIIKHYLDLAKDFSKKRDYENANGAMLELSDIGFSTHRLVQYEFAKLHIQFGRYLEALNIADVFLKSDPYSFNFLSIKIQADFYLGRYKEVILTSEDMIRIHSSKRSKLNSILHSYRFMIYSLENLGEFQRAINEAKSFLELKPEDAKMHMLLARIYTQQSNYAEAIRSYKKVIEIKPSEDLYIDLAKIYDRQGNIDMVVSTLIEGISKLNPKIENVIHAALAAYVRRDNPQYEFFSTRYTDHQIEILEWRAKNFSLNRNKAL